MLGRFTARRVAAPSLVPEAVIEAVPVLAEGAEGAEAAMPAAAPPPPPPGEAAPDPAVVANRLLSEKLLDAKVRLHRRLIEEINLSALERMPVEDVRRYVHQLVSQYVLNERLALNAQELESFVDEILDEMTGLGPIEPLLKDPTVNDILINGHECVYIERAGMLEPVSYTHLTLPTILRV